MANILIVVDPDADRRSQFIRAVEPLLPIVPGLQTASCASGDFCAVWATSVRAHVSAVDDREGAVVLWGDAIPGPGPQRIQAQELKRVWDNCAEKFPAPFNGFHAGVVYRPETGVTVGADLLGMFPIYYYATDTVLLVGSSPELFRYHPAFVMKFNPAALVGMLLLMHPLGGDTLFQGVRRLAAGHLLFWRPRESPKEARQYQVPISERYFDLPFSAQVQVLNETLDQAIARHVPAGKQYGLMLSGGRDSRMLGGYLKRRHTKVVAFTLGNSAFEHDLEIARSVAQALGFEHHSGTVLQDQYPLYAELHARWTHGLCGFNQIMFWGIQAHLRDLPAYVVMGYVMDAILGGTHLDWAYSASARAMSFEAFFGMVNRSGFHPDILRKVLRPEIFRDLIEEALARIRSTFDSYASLESQRAWCFDLYHRQRFFIGSLVWQESFGAWPILPIVDQEVLAVVGGMPASTIAERRAQDELLCSQFPQLAALPLDTCPSHPDPLQPRLRWRLRRGLENRLPLLRRLQEFRDSRKGERNFYYGLWNVNGPGWSNVRRLADTNRDRVLEFFQKDFFETLLPPPHVPLHFEEPIMGASGVKSLLGFLLWSRDHL